MLENQVSPFRELVQGRKSIRRFNSQSLERERVNLCLDAARLAPSAENAQPWRFLVIDDPQVKQDFAAQAFSGIYRVSVFAEGAPVLIVIRARRSVVTQRVGPHIQDIGIAGQHIVLQAEELGIGTCWLGWFSIRKSRKYFKIPAKYKIMSMLAMGYYEKKPSRERKRKTLEEIVFYNQIRD